MVYCNLLFVVFVVHMDFTFYALVHPICIIYAVSLWEATTYILLNLN